jgi:hypothetical protein
LLKKNCSKNKKSGKSLLSFPKIFASFFGAAMIAGAYAYFHFKFTEYKFFNFNELIFYEKKNIFTPKDDYYTVVVYSSNMSNSEKFLEEIQSDNKIIAIDLYQKRTKENSEKTIYITSGINTILQFVQKFNIYNSPSVFIIKKHNKNLYKQDSMITTF